ncbi:MAG: endonuclease/exonuclease/phosphatase family protein [Bacteroidota bacterium]
MFNFNRNTNQAGEVKKKLGWFNRFVLFLNFLSITGLLLSYSARYVSPEKFWPIAFFGIGYPLLFLINCAFIIFWILQLKKQFLFSFITILLGYSAFFSYFHINSKKNSEKGIKLISYNCMLFDLYNWSKNENSRKNIFKTLEEQKPDILCLQEFYTSENPRSFDNISDLKTQLKLQNYFKHYTTTLRNEDHWGMITFSKFPIINSGVIEFNTRTNNACIFTDLLIEKDTVRVYNLHLQSIQFGKDDYKYVTDVIENKNEENLEHSRSILKRLKRGFIKRAKQAELISNHIKKCSLKTIVCGDFNDTPTSYAYHTVKGEFSDAFTKKGSGLEKTYRGKFPAFRIDNILYSEGIEALAYKKVEINLTDHYPISLLLKIKE